MNWRIVQSKRVTLLQSATSTLIYLSSFSTATATNINRFFWNCRHSPSTAFTCIPIPIASSTKQALIPPLPESCLPFVSHPTPKFISTMPTTRSGRVYHSKQSNSNPSSSSLSCTEKIPFVSPSPTLKMESKKRYDFSRFAHKGDDMNHDTTKNAANGTQEPIIKKRKRTKDTSSTTPTIPSKTRKSLRIQDITSTEIPKTKKTKPSSPTKNKKTPKKSSDVTNDMHARTISPTRRLDSTLPYIFRN